MAFFKCIRGTNGSNKLIIGQIYEGYFDTRTKGTVRIANHGWLADRFEEIPLPLATEEGALEYEEAMAAQELLG